VNGAANAASQPRRARGVWLPSCWAADQCGFYVQQLRRGKSNQLAKAAAIQVAGNPGKAYNPLFIYAASVLQTHLMHAVANQIKENNAMRGSRMFTASVSSAIWSRRCSTTPSTISNGVSLLDALMIDDIQFLRAKTVAREFFHTSMRCWRSAAGHLDVRPLSEGSRRSGGAIEIRFAGD